MAVDHTMRTARREAGTRSKRSGLLLARFLRDGAATVPADQGERAGYSSSEEFSDTGGRQARLDVVDDS